MESGHRPAPEQHYDVAGFLLLDVHLNLVTKRDLEAFDDLFHLHKHVLVHVMGAHCVPGRGHLLLKQSDLVDLFNRAG